MIELQAAVDKLDVPPYKKDVQKGHNVEWLIANLHKRNSQHALYVSAMHMLLNYAEAHKMLKRTEIERHREQLKRTVVAVKPEFPPSRVVSDTTDGVHPPALMNVPRNGAPLYPHQEAALKRLASDGGVRAGEMLIFNAAGKAGRIALAEVALALEPAKDSDTKFRVLKDRNTQSKDKLIMNFEPGLKIGEQSKSRLDRPRVSPNVVKVGGKSS